MKTSVRAYLQKSYDDFRKRPLLVISFLVAFTAMPIMIIERLIAADVGFEIDSLKKYLTDTFAQEPVKYIFLFIIITPIVEELFYRGPVRLLDYLLSKTSLNLYLQSVVLALIVVVQAHFWAMPHIAPVCHFVIGILLGLMVIKTKSWLAVVLIHVVFNALSITSILISCWLF